VGQEYTDHVDGYDATTEHGANNCARGGNRCIKIRRFCAAFSFTGDLPRQARVGHGKLKTQTVGFCRLVTSLVYLSDVPAGGQTTFANLELTVEPQQGRMLVRN
jgi:hypothetical protein